MSSTTSTLWFALGELGKCRGQGRNEGRFRFRFKARVELRTWKLVSVEVRHLVRVRFVLP